MTASPLLDLIAKHILAIEDRMEAHMAEFSQMKSAVSALTGAMAALQADNANLHAQIDASASAGQEAIDAAVAAAIADHDRAVQSEIDGITAEIVNATPQG